MQKQYQAAGPHLHLHCIGRIYSFLTNRCTELNFVCQATTMFPTSTSMFLLFDCDLGVFFILPFGPSKFLLLNLKTHLLGVRYLIRFHIEYIFDMVN